MGMPRLRQAYVPQPVVDRSAADLRAYIEGQDPISRRPFMQEVLDGLLTPLDEADLQGLSFERTTPAAGRSRQRGRPPAIVRREQLDGRASDRAADRGARRGDAQRDESSAGQDRRPAPPDAFREYWEFTVEKVAVNAVMAGARPEYFPVILALASSGISARSSSTNSFATITVVNGPSATRSR
jgi:hypothetical protein